MIRLVVVVVLVLSLLVGFGPGAGAQQPIKIRFAWQPYNAVLFYTARDLKLFEKAGLDAELVKFTAGPPQFAAYRSASIDAGLFGTAGFVVGLSQGLDLKNFYIQIVSAYADGLVVRPDSGIASLKDLKGKKIAYLRGTSAHIGLVTAAARAGLAPADIQMVTMDITNMVPAFTAKDIDGAYAWEPWVSKMEAAGGTVLTRTIDLGLNTSDHWVVREQWARSNPEGMRRLVRVVDLAYEAFKRDPGVAIRATAENLGVTEAVARHIVDINPTLSLQQNVDPMADLSLTPAPGRPGAAGMIQRVADFLSAQEILRTKVDAKAAVEGSWVADYLRTKR
ncbi:MAG TPA: NrtA/SsuA/CpmA family ABC transporter substrate-binding protein [Methylomirabilota bacterium]|jgi:aliphatic sulfonates family ABC transporter substrate-binding protein|nr:NrtA/SsuA/CpmA family ABC transporter substrate-binding protein [Methylomirabilota bacterium]HEV8615243.1 NrtA/SsuA/CpmA family ABC transporter substrate-binding protein [Methylomirabilota bacterium]